MRKIKLAIVDNNQKYRAVIKGAIQLENDMEVILESENGRDLLKNLEFVTPDVILLDILMPEMDGIQAAAIIKHSFPKLKIIALSQYHESHIIEMNIRGAKGFIGKDDHLTELLKAIRIVNDGGIYLTEYSAYIIQRHLRRVRRDFESSIELNEREEFLLKAICEGLSSTQIGRAIHKSPRTIEEYREKLYKKFNVRCKEELLRRTLGFDFPRD